MECVSVMVEGAKVLNQVVDNRVRRDGAMTFWWHECTSYLVLTVQLEWICRFLFRQRPWEKMWRNERDKRNRLCHNLMGVRLKGKYHTCVCSLFFFFMILIYLFNLSYLSIFFFERQRNCLPSLPFCTLCSIFLTEKWGVRANRRMIAQEWKERYCTWKYTWKYTRLEAKPSLRMNF